MSGSAAAKAQQQKNAGRVDTRSQEQSPRPAFSGVYEDILALQQSAGNQAVHAWMQGTVTPIVHPLLNSGGQSLDSALRSQMESRFGEDFGNVRVHSDQEAADSAESLGARAYTSGEHVVFGPKLFAPNTAGGKRLLAHELTHVVQQRHGTGSTSEYAGAEMEARQVGAQVASGQTVNVQSGGSGGIQMDTKDDDDPVLREFDRRQALKDNPPMGSKEWELRFKSVSAVTSQQAGTSSAQGQMQGGFTHGDERAHKSPPKPAAMPAPDPKTARELVSAWAEQQKINKERWRKIKAESGIEDREDVEKRQAESKGFGPNGPTEKRLALQGSPILALHETFEKQGFGGVQDIEPYRQAVLSTPREEFLKRYPNFSAKTYDMLRDYFQANSRNWKNYLPPDAQVDVSLRKILKLDPKDYISQNQLDALATPLGDDKTRSDIGRQSGLSEVELQGIRRYLARTGRHPEQSDKDPVIAVQGYASIRQSQYESILFQQRMEDLRFVTESTLAGIGYGGASLVTDSHEERMAWARAGAWAEGVAGAVGGTGAARQHMETAGQSVSPTDRPAIVAPSNLKKPPPGKRPSGGVGAEAIDLARQRGTINEGSVGEQRMNPAPPVLITQAGQGGVTPLAPSEGKKPLPGSMQTATKPSTGGGAANDNAVPVRDANEAQVAQQQSAQETKGGEVIGVNFRAQENQRAMASGDRSRSSSSPIKGMTSRGGNTGAPVGSMTAKPPKAAVPVNTRPTSPTLPGGKQQVVPLKPGVVKRVGPKPDKTLEPADESLSQEARAEQGGKGLLTGVGEEVMDKVGETELKQVGKAPVSFSPAPADVGDAAFKARMFREVENVMRANKRNTIGSGGEAAAQANARTTAMDLNAVKTNFPQLDTVSRETMASVKAFSVDKPLSASVVARYDKELQALRTVIEPGVPTKLGKAAAWMATHREPIQAAGAWPNGLARNATPEQIAKFVNQQGVLAIPADHVGTVRAAVAANARANPAAYGLTPGAGLDKGIERLTARVQSLGLTADEIMTINKMVWGNP